MEILADTSIKQINEHDFFLCIKNNSVALFIIFLMYLGRCYCCGDLGFENV
jgi:hypothetical protein